MMHSPEATELPSALQHTLTELVPDAELSEAVLAGACLPVILMESRHSVHAFAVGNESEYLELYEAFKKHFFDRAPEWTAKDVSFIFCIPLGEDVSEGFPSKVEVDVYFCRKYVVKFGTDLKASLARLPFLPLAPISGGPMRPPSAKTLLRQRSMVTELANSLIEPGTSAAAILENCLSGKHGVANVIEKRSLESSIKVTGEQREQATLKSISIENFRAYRKKKEFELGSAITVLYGPNGFGKTSFFDAVDFVVTGGVGRLDKASGGLSKVAKHLDSQDEPTQITLKFESSGREHVIVRNLSAPNDATLDGKVASRKVILNSLTGGTAGTTDRVDNLVSLFRATHLFSQDRQVLTQEVAARCELPADIVSRMLAFDDYVNGIKKVNEVLRLAKLERVRSVERAKTARSSIRTDAAELQRLEGILSSASSEGALTERYEELVASITDGGFDSAASGVRDTRGLRAQLEAASAEAGKRRAQIERCFEHVANVKLEREQLLPLQSQAEQARLVVEQVDLAVRESSGNAASAANEAASKKSGEDEAKNLRDWLLWAVSVYPDYSRLTAEVQTQSNRLSSVSETALRHREALSQAEVRSGEAEASLRTKNKAVADAAAKRSVMQRAEAILEVTQFSFSRLAELQKNESQKSSDLEELRQRLSVPSAALAAQGAVVTGIEQQLKDAKKDADKLKSLVAELRAHIKGSECLLCGHDHGSQQELLAAVDSRGEQADIVMRMSESFVTAREKFRELESQVQTYKATLAVAEDLAKKALGEKDVYSKQLAEANLVFSSVGLSIDEALGSNSLLELSAQSLGEERLAQEVANSARATLEELKSQVHTAQQVYESAESERKSIIRLIEDSKQRLNELLAEAQTGGVNLANGAEALQHSLEEREFRLAVASAVSNESVATLESARAAQKVLESQARAAKEAQQLSLRAVQHIRALMQFRIGELSAAGLEDDATEVQVANMLQAVQARELAALAFRDRVAELEVATDTAATSAAFQSIRARIDANERDAKKAEAQFELLEPWIKYFEGVSGLLSGQQALATEHFTTDYGPRTEMIQQRLRPVYGFDGVAVTSKDSAIQIHIRRNGENLRPTDFFSQSQIQTLVLGLFLTACSSQTWSGFSSIMMDDPVTHFDNLNTYALLDLILGLQSTSDGGRQFVISTCDEKLLQLARHKFRHLGSAAKFYRFSAIGAEGPMVAELPI